MENIELKRKIKILIVDDDLITAKNIKESIEAAGFEVIAITSKPEQAIAIFASQVLDVLLVDINLHSSSLDGISLANIINKIQPVPTIFITGDDNQKLFERAKLATPFAYLTKPIQAKQLINHIELAVRYFNTKAKDFSQYDKEKSFFLPVKQGEFKKINIDDVTYLEANGSYVRIHYANGTETLYTMNLKYLSQYFSFSNFYKLSRTFIINLDYLERLDGSEVWLQGASKGLIVPRERKNEFLNQIRIVRTQNYKK